MKIIRGKQSSAKKVVIYGPEGIGKSTFANKFPDPVFIDTEGSTKDMDVARFEKATSWQMLLEQCSYVRDNPSVCRTLVIDTIDWAEQMCIKQICDKHNKDGIESFGYGNGYVYVKEEFGRFLNLLSDVVDAGVNVVLTAHAQIRKFEQPDEMGAYDRWELKLGKKTSSQTSPLVKEWADMLLFANYKIYSVSTDKDGKKHKAQGGRRVMYTTHHACWDAKNRYGLPDECDFDYAVIRDIIEPNLHSRKSVQQNNSENTVIENPEHKQTKSLPQPEKKTEEAKSMDRAAEEPVTSRQGEQMSLPLDSAPDKSGVQSSGDKKNNEEVVTDDTLDKRIPKVLRDLMLSSSVGEWTLQSVVNARLPGAFPEDMEVKDYPQDFLDEWVIPNWGKIVSCAKEMREKMEIPFN